MQLFYDFFPNVDSSPFWIKEVVQIAMQHNVEINGSEYRMVREKGVKLARYEMRCRSGANIHRCALLSPMPCVRFLPWRWWMWR